MKLLGRSVLVLLTLLAAAAGGVYALLRPPAPLALPERGISLSDITVVNPGLERLAHRSIVVTDTSIGSIGSAVPSGDDPFVGMYVLPGLTDMHVHFPPPALGGITELFAFLHLYHGVTAIRDAGDIDGTASDPARTGIREGRFPGPRIFSCGPFVDGDPPLWGNSIVARNPEEGRVAVAEIARRGYECVKVYNGLDSATLAAIREAAHEMGLPVIGHVPRQVAYGTARLDDAQHLIGVDPPGGNKSLRFPLVLESWLHLDDEHLAAIISDALEHGITNTPTLITIDRLLATEDAERVKHEPDAQLLPRYFREVIWDTAGPASPASKLRPEDFQMVRSAFEIMKRSVLTMYTAGVKIHTGTDTLVAFVVPGASLHRELRLFVDAGFTPEQALATSTRDSAQFLDSKLGVLREGAPAEFVIFREDPTKSLAALDTIAGIVRDGRLYPRWMLDAQLEIYRAHFDDALYDTIVTPIVRRVLAGTFDD